MLLGRQMPSLSRIRNFRCDLRRALVGIALLGLTTVGHDDIKYPIHIAPVVCRALASFGGRLPARVCQPSSPTICSQSEVFSHRAIAVLCSSSIFLLWKDFVCLAMLQQFDSVVLGSCIRLFALPVSQGHRPLRLTELIHHPRAFLAWESAQTVSQTVPIGTGSVPGEAKTRNQTKYHIVSAHL